MFNVKCCGKTVLEWSEKRIQLLFSCPFPNTCPFQTLFYRPHRRERGKKNILYFKCLSSNSLETKHYVSFVISVTLSTYKRFIYFFSEQMDTTFDGFIDLIKERKKHYFRFGDPTTNLAINFVFLTIYLNTLLLVKKNQLDLDLFLAFFWYFFL